MFNHVKGEVFLKNMRDWLKKAKNREKLEKLIR